MLSVIVSEETATDVVMVPNEPAPVASPLSAPDTVQPVGAVPDSFTGSLNVMTTELRETYFAEETSGAMPSDTVTDDIAASALDDVSVIAPEPEPGSPGASVPDIS